MALKSNDGPPFSKLVVLNGIVPPSPEFLMCTEGAADIPLVKPRMSFIQAGGKQMMTAGASGTDRLAGNCSHALELSLDHLDPYKSAYA